MSKLKNIVNATLNQPPLRTRVGHRLKYFVTMGSIVALFGMVAVAPQLTWSAEPAAASLYAPGEMPTQEVIAAAAAEAEHYLAALEVETLPEPEPDPVILSDTAADSIVQRQVAAPPMYSGGGSPEAWMTAAGIAPENWGYVDFIASKESGWNPNATNPSSGACGLIQAYPCSKVPGGGYDPVANLTWAQGYAVGRYGSWAAAYDFWNANRWW